jgi:hypothetical protein
MPKMSSLWAIGAAVVVAAACTRRERPAAEADAPAPATDVPKVEEEKAEANDPQYRHIGADQPRQPVPGPAGEMAPEEIAFDGRETSDTSSERNTVAHQGFTPIADRMPGERIEVATVREFVSALGSDRTILMKPGIYVWRDADVLGYTDAPESYDDLSEHWRGGTIHDVENLAIVGLGTGARILQPDAYDHVIAFHDVAGLTLYNLVLGHHVDRGGCAGGVVRILGGRDIVLDGVEMFGSGTEGLTMQHVENVEVRHSVVWGCSEQLSTIADAQDVRIRDTVFRDNGPDLLRGFNLARVALRMDRVAIRANLCGAAMEGYGTLFSDGSGYSVFPGVVDHGTPEILVQGPKRVSVAFTDGVIEANEFDRMSDHAGVVKLLRSRVDRGSFR